MQVLEAFAYDENSNPVSTTDATRARNNSAKHPFDVVYDVDDLNRVIAADEGNSDRDEHAYTYDAVGNLTDLAATIYRGANSALTHRRLVYDAFGRLVRAAAVDGMDETDVALYRYNGLNMRLMWHDDADADSSLESSERFYVMFDERWRPVATFRDTDSTPKEAFVWHAAGQGGFGGSSYIDSIILRDRDNSTGGTPNGMTSASDGTLEERRVFCQNWRADVVAVTKSDGTPIEYVRYSAYGEPTVYPVADLNMDGVVNSTDSSLWTDLLYSTSNASVYANSDLDFDGLDDWNSGGADGDLFYESYNANTGLSGVGRVSSPGVSNRTGYAGYQWDQTISASHVRYRVYLPDIGRWTRRDPLGYVDGASLHQYVGSSVSGRTDGDGRVGVDCPNPSACYDQYRTESLGALLAFGKCEFGNTEDIVVHVACAVACLAALEAGKGGYLGCMAVCEGAFMVGKWIGKWMWGVQSCWSLYQTERDLAKFKYASCRWARRRECPPADREELIEPFDPATIIAPPVPQWVPRTGYDALPKCAR